MSGSSFGSRPGTDEERASAPVTSPFSSPGSLPPGPGSASDIWTPAPPPGYAGPEAPPPPPPSGIRLVGDGRDAEGVSDRFASIVAIVIAFMSIASAVVAWRASEASNLAQDLDNRAVQELAQQQQARQGLEGLVAQDRRLLIRYQGHVGAARGLRERAAELRGENAELADVLELEAHAEQAQARVLAPYFRGGGLRFADDGSVSYDEQAALADLFAGDETLRELRPDETQAEGDRQHRKALELVGSAAVIIGALFFLTIASIGARRLRPLFAALGGIAAAAGLTLFAVVEFLR